jgi:hypothetical protein
METPSHEGTRLRGRTRGSFNRPEKLFSYIDSPENVGAYVRIVLTVLAASATLLFWLKWQSFQSGYYRSDMFLFSNALHNTDFASNWLRVEEYAMVRGFYSLLQDHFQPTTLLLVPLVKLFGGAGLMAISIVFFASPPLLVLRWQVQTSAPAWSVLLLPLMWISSGRVFKEFADFVYGFHNDLQYPFYASFALYFSMRRKWAFAAVAWVLFLGVKETAPLYSGTFAFLMLVRTLIRGGERGERTFFAVLWLASMIWFVFAIMIFPRLAGTHQMYLDRGLGLLAGPEALHIDARKLSDGIQQYLYWLPAFAQPTFVVATLPDFLVLLIYGRSPVFWYGLVINTFLLFGAVGAAPSLSTAAQGRPIVRQALATYVLVMLAMCFVQAAGSTRRALSAGESLFAASPADIMRAVEQVDPACRVAISDNALRFVDHLPYLLAINHSETANRARFIIEVAPTPLAQQMQRGRPPSDSSAERQLLFEAHGVRVYENPAAECPGRRATSH